MRGLMSGTRSAAGRFAAASAAGGLLVAAVAGAPARAAAGPAVTCTYTIQSVWSGGFVAQIEIADNGPAPINGWTVRWSFSAYTTGITAWQSVLSAPDGIHATATNASYNATIPSGYRTSFGWSGQAVSTSVPTDLTINGTAC